jgi:hypothetical protein
MRLIRATWTVVATLALTPQAFAEGFTAGSGGPAPESVPDITRQMIAPEGVTVKAGDVAVVTFWMRSAPFEGELASGFGVRFDNVPEGAFLGVLEFPERGSDFREQSVPPGVYTIRFGLHPEDGNHMGVAPSRDFALLSPVDQDLEIATNFDFDGIVELSAKVGNPHPTVARLELPEGDEGPNLWENDYEQWVLDLPVAGTVLGIVVDGHAEE